MATRKEIGEMLDFRRTALAAARDAYTALLSGQVQSYAIGSRNLTRLDLEKLKNEINELEKEISELTAQMSGLKRRRALGVVPRDW